MDQVKEYVSMVVIALIAVEMLLALTPEGNMKRFTKLAVGLLLLGMLLMPLTQCKGESYNFEMPTENVEERTQKSYEDIILDVYNSQLENTN